MKPTPPSELDRIAPGTRVVVRDHDWQVVGVERLGVVGGGAIVRCVGKSELVQGRLASFFSELDYIEPEDPTRTEFRLDTSPHGVETRLILESLLRRTPVPIANTNLTVGHQVLADDLPYQREPFRMAMEQLQPRLLIADAVGLGKTIEVGILLSELQRRGRANRVLAVVPRHILDQIQHELWSRFAFPLVRLDSAGIQRLRQRIPAGQNPFSYFNRVIVSIDTLKNPSRYRHHLERVRWDVVWIDEAHSVANRSALRSHLARVLAPNADALLLTTATPHNGKPDAFANLVNLLDPTAVPDPAKVTVDNIRHLVIRLHKHSPDVAAVVGGQWAERLEPMPISVKPSAAEEELFRELSTTWLAKDTDPPSKDHLFPYTLLKAALSSAPALSETIENRLTQRRRRAIKASSPNPSPLDAEEEALRRLYTLSEEAAEAGSAKLDTLVSTLKEIGVKKGSPTRVVIFSERIRTLDWIAKAVRERLGMSEEEVQTFHNSKTDEEQQQIIEAFSMASAPIRVLVTSDIASEGVNLHKQCHHLIHFDLPWSLITLEQRNGRIDRYGQTTPPEIRYLIYNPEDPEIASDVRVLAKLIEKENVAHRALGDAASVMGLYSETAEEKAVIEALRQRTEEDRLAAIEAKAPNKAVFDPWKFLGLESQDSTPTVEPSPPVPVDPLPTLFDSGDEYLEAGLRLVYGDPQHSLDWEADGPVISFRPPDDLIRRLEALPSSYLRQRNLRERLRLTADRDIASESLRRALETKAGEGESGTAWPEIHYLAPQHPVFEWLADKLLYRLGRNEAIALACDVEEPTILVSGLWANRLGEPIAGAWLAATVEDGLVTFEDMAATLSRVGITEEFVNSAWDGDLSFLSTLTEAVVNAAAADMHDRVQDELERIKHHLASTRRRLEEWQEEARRIAESIRSPAHRNRRLRDIERVTRQIESLIEEHTPADSPLIRVIGALVPRGSR